MTKKLKAAILKWWQKGKNVWEISQLTGATEQQVYEVINE